MGPFHAPQVLVAQTAPLEHDPADLRARAQDLLSRPPYTEPDAGLVTRVLRWVGDALADLVQRLAGAFTGDPAFAWAVVVVGAALLGVVVWRATRGTILDRRIADVAGGPASRSAADWHRDADRHEAAGELVAALRCRYAAMVAALVEEGILDDVPGRTVRELDAEVAASSPALASAVDAAGRRIEAVVYGNEPVRRRDLEVVATAARAAAGRDRAGAGRRRAPAEAATGARS